MPKAGDKAQSTIPVEARDPNLYQHNCPDCGDTGYVVFTGTRRQTKMHRKVCKTGCARCDDPTELARPCGACRTGVAIRFGGEWAGQGGPPKPVDPRRPHLEPHELAQVDPGDEPSLFEANERMRAFDPRKDFRQ